MTGGAVVTLAITNGAGGALQVAFDVAGRHLRDPSMSPARDRLVALSGFSRRRFQPSAGNCSSTHSGPSRGRRYERPPTRT